MHETIQFGAIMRRSRAIAGIGALVVFMCVVGPLLGCGSAGWEIDEAPPGVETAVLTPVFHLDRPLWTLRLVIADGGATRIEQLEEYTTVFTALDAAGRPHAARRQYHRALHREISGGSMTEEYAGEAEEPIVLIAGDVARRPDGSPLMGAAGHWLAPAGFDAAFLPAVAVYPGASWRVPEDRAAPLLAFIRRLGLVPDENDIRLTWRETANDAPPTTVAELVLQWRATGTLTGGTRAVRGRLDISGVVRFDRAARLIVDLDLSITQSLEGQVGTSRLRLLRRWDGPPDSLPDDLPDIREPARTTDDAADAPDDAPGEAPDDAPGAAGDDDDEGTSRD